MNRRQWIAMMASVLAALRWPRHAHAQDSAYVRSVEAALAEFSGVRAATERIAVAGEPGVPLRVRGTLLADDGRTPLGSALVFAYHTDRHGLCNPHNAPHSWRLRGAVRTAADGSFEFHTIRPASYPQTRIPQHIHVTLRTAEGRYHAGEWRFADDPMVDEQERASSARAGAFGWVCPVQVAAGVHTIAVQTRVNRAQRF